MSSELNDFTEFDEVTPSKMVEVAPENRNVQKIIDDYEKKIYDLNQLLEVSRSLCSTLEFSNLVESIIKMLTFGGKTFKYII